MDSARPRRASRSRSSERARSSKRDIDPDGVIMVCAAGRASMYVATLAAVMGLHIRVGMEDSYWLWPHRDDRIESTLPPVFSPKMVPRS